MHLIIVSLGRPIKKVPKWVREALCKGYAEIFNARAGSWDDVFGRPKGHLKQRRRRQGLQFPIWKRIRYLRATGKGLDDNMFAAIGEEFGVGARQAKSMYYAIERSSDRWQPRRRRKASVPQK